MNCKPFVVLFCLAYWLPSPSSSAFRGYALPPKDENFEGNEIGQRKYNPPIDNDVEEAPEQPTGFICGLCFVLDEEFSQAYGLSEEMIPKIIDKLVDYASWLFRSLDLDNDGKVDNIGFLTKQISYGWKPYRQETQAHYDKPKLAGDLLKVFARLNFSHCCLGIGITNRPLLNDQDGIAFGASKNLHGGICDHRKPAGENIINTNVILITGRGPNNTQLPPQHISKTLIHELGHAFGAHSHDNSYNDPDCWGFRSDEKPYEKGSQPSDGRFIMWEKRSQNAQGGLLPRKNNYLFSRCSLFQMGPVVSNRKQRAKCFDIDYNPFCGNGISEGMEMCDCGNEYSCAQQKCCGSRNSKRPCEILDKKECPNEVLARMGEGVPPNNTITNSTAPIRYNDNVRKFVIAGVVISMLILP